MKPHQWIMVNPSWGTNETGVSGEEYLAIFIQIKLHPNPLSDIDGDGFSDCYEAYTNYDPNTEDATP